MSLQLKSVNSGFNYTGFFSANNLKKHLLKRILQKLPVCAPVEMMFKEFGDIMLNVVVFSKDN